MAESTSNIKHPAKTIFTLISGILIGAIFSYVIFLYSFKETNVFNSIEFIHYRSFLENPQNVFMKSLETAATFRKPEDFKALAACIEMQLPKQYTDPNPDKKEFPYPVASLLVRLGHDSVPSVVERFYHTRNSNEEYLLSSVLCAILGPEFALKTLQLELSTKTKVDEIKKMEHAIYKVRSIRNVINFFPGESKKQFFVGETYFKP